MKILVDECLPSYLKSLFPTASAETVQEAGWSSVKNGPLLKLAEDTYDVFLIVGVGIDARISAKRCVFKFTDAFGNRLVFIRKEE